jgi:segregation and condensation protein A
MSPSVLDLDLDLDAFSGPFDLLLALVLRQELELVEVPLAAIVVTYLEQLALASEADLESVSEFCVLIAALCELKARLLIDADDEIDELDPEDAAAELAARLAEYRRFKQAAGWLAERREAVGRRVFRIGAAAVAPPRRDLDLPEEQSGALVEAIEGLLVMPERLDTSQVRGRTVSVRPFIERFRQLLAASGTFLFDEQVLALPREEQSAAFLAVLELYKRGEVRVAQRDLFAPIRVARSSGLLVRPLPAVELERDEAVA